MSRALAAVGLVVTAPVLVLAGLAIKASSRGPVLFRTRRLGRDGQPFTMLKLRTMHQRRAALGLRITGGRDTRVFAAGRLIRRAKVDELPQLINVLRGDMALVGPRPEDPSIVEEYYTPFMMRTLAVLPGLTSPGSLNYYAREAQLPDDGAEAERIYVSDLLPRKIALDLMYIHNRSWRYDVELVVRTVASMLAVPGAFRRRQAWELDEAERLLASIDRQHDHSAAVLP